MNTAVALGVTAGLAGLIAAYHLGLPTGPAVALCTVAEVAAAALIRHARARPPRNPGATLTTALGERLDPGRFEGRSRA